MQPPGERPISLFGFIVKRLTSQSLSGTPICLDEFGVKPLVGTFIPGLLLPFGFLQLPERPGGLDVFERAFFR